MSNFWKDLKKAGKPIMALAPMAGVTDMSFRGICKEYGADVIYTEFASVNALFYDSKKTLATLKFQERERPIVVQIFGKDPTLFADAAKKLEKIGFDGIDINFGCPAKKVFSSGGGVSLMRNLPLCRDIVMATLEATRLPVSIKIRSSIKRIPTKEEIIFDPSCEKNSCNKNISNKTNKEKITAEDLVVTLIDLPLSAIMIHARSYETPFDGEPDLPMVKTIRGLYEGVLLANGGVRAPEDAKKMISETGADGIGIARGAYGNPWIFKQCEEYINNGTYHEYTFDEKINIIIRHATLAEEAKGPHGLIEMRKHLAWYVKGLPGASVLRSKLVRTSTIQEIKDILTQYTFERQNLPDINEKQLSDIN